MPKCTQSKCYASIRGWIAKFGVEAGLTPIGNGAWAAAAEGERAAGLGQRGDRKFFATLKTELVHHEEYASHEEAKRSIFEYIEVFCNRQRLHSTLS